MIKRFLKSSVIFFVILGVAFSNVPFYALSGLIDSYAKTTGIVDKIWLVQQNHNSDVVDNFSSIKNFSKKLEIPSAAAAVANDAASESHTGTTGNASAASFTWNHTPVGTPRGVLVFVYTIAAAKTVTSVTYGGVTMTEITGGAAVDTATEPGRIDTFFLGTGIGTGVKAIVVNRTNNANVMYAAAVTQTAGADTEVYTPGIVLLQENGTFTVNSVTDGSTGVNSVRYAAGYSGGSAVLPAGTGSTVLNSIDFGVMTVTTARETTAGQGARNVGFNYATSDDRAAVHLAVREVVPPVTTITNFVSAEPGNSTIAPNASGMVDSFGFATNTGTDTVTAATVGLAAGMWQYIQTVAITNDAGGTTYCSATPSSDSVSLSSCTIPVTTTNTQFKIKITADPHASMPVPAGGSYAVTATVTGWTGTNATHAGTDSGSSTLTIDNTSPSGATSVSGTAGNAANTINWTTSNSGDFDTTNGSVVLRWASGSAGAEVPAEGNSTYTAGNTITTATVACVISSATSAAQSKIDGTGGSAGCTTSALTNGQAYTYKAFQRDTNGNYDVGVLIGTFTPSAPAMTLTISQTAGSKVATKNSGDVNQYAHDTACTGAGTCSAFTLASALGTSNVTSIKITETGTVTANTELSDLNLYYDYDGNWADAGAETLFGTVANFAGDQTATVSGTLAITDGVTAYIYARYDLANGAVYPTGGDTVNFQIAASTDVVSDATESGTGTLVGTQTVKPQITGYTNSTEPALDYAGACTGCGARIGGGSGFRHTLIISGYGFGADPGLGSRDTATNKVEIAGTATTVLADDGSANTNVSAWSSTSITIRTDSNIATNTDTDFGTNFGGATALKVTAGGQAVPTNLNFYIFPQITSLTQPGGFPADSAREYDAGDTDGVITLNGTRFGSSLGSGSVTILGSSATTNSWTNTAIEARVPTAISDSVYTGAVAMTQGTGSNAKTDSYSTLRILPRITSSVPSNGIIGASVTVNGDHFCQAGAASCPVAFGANDKVTFTSAVDATVFTSWSNTAIVTAVPTGAVTGNVVVTSNAPPAYTSNALTFTVDANTTTLATGSDPAVNTIAPGASATDVDLFTLQTNGGTESVTSVTVNLSTHLGIGLLAITDNANTVLGSTASPVTGSNVISVAGMSAGTGVTTFKVRATPLSHASQPAPAGASYAVTAPVTAWAGSNTHAGSDTNTNALTIDNTSPAGTTSATPTAGDTQVQLSWTNPGDSDFQKVIIYCKTSSITETPTEGSDPSVDATACDATARVKYSGSVSPQTITGLSNGTLYYFRIYARDTNGNFTAIASTEQVSATPTLTQTLTVGTVGTQAVNLNSGSTAQHIGGAGTAAFTLQINTGSSNVTSVKVSDTGTVAMANLANPKLYYENAVNAASCAYGGAESFVSGAAPVGETVTFTLPSVAVGLTANVTCLYFVSDVTSSASGGQTIELEITNPSTDVAVSSGVNSDTVAKAITGTTTVKPQITGYTNSTEPALDYAGACTGCGARIGGGSGFRHTLIISGYGFGADPGLGSRDTATNKVEIAGTATTVLADDGSANTNVSAWSNTSITIRTDTNITGNSDTDFGTNFGGATALKVTAGGQAVPTNLNFYIFPQITSLTQPGGFPADSAREYDAGDTDGVITLNGTRFGSSLGSGAVTILGSSATTNSWSNTAIEARVPTAILDSVYTGSVAMTQGTGGNSKTHSYSTLRILPRITSLDPVSASVGDPITVNGNHFCQAGAASCPVAFGTNDKVIFTSSVDATVFTSWSNTVIVTAVPTGAVTGNVVVKSDAPTYTSNGSSFTLASATPDDPTSLGQFKDAGFTQTIAIGGTASSTPIYLKMTMSAALSGGTLYPQVEYKAIGSAFACGAGVCGTASEGTGSAGPGPATGSVSVSPADEVYHWQARIRHNRNSVDYYSAWVSFGSGNPENETDFKIDTTAPVITSTSSGSPGTNGATITWSTSGEISTSRVEYDTAGTFTGGYDCAGTSECTTLADTSPMVNSHSVTLSNLNSATTYHYRVRSKDAAGNEKIDPTSGDYTFVTQTENHPAKSTNTFIDGATGTISSATTYYFKVDAPETAPSVKSAYVEVVGVVSGGTGTVTVAVNGSSRAYDVSAANPTLYRFMYPIVSPNTETNLNLNDVAPCSNAVVPGTPPKCNKVVLTPATVSVNVLSAKIITTYSYTP